MNVEDTVIGILAEDHDIIPYRKSLRKIAGSVTATILLQQMIWRGKHHKWEPFYKFKSPCGHELYKSGDSWTEEMGFSEEEFDAAIKRIGTKIVRGTSKSDARAGDDPTSLVIYWTDANRVTWYHVNKDLLGKLVLAVYLVSGESPDTLKTVKPNLPVVPKTPTENKNIVAQQQTAQKPPSIFQTDLIQTSSGLTPDEVPKRKTGQKFSTEEIAIKVAWTKLKERREPGCTITWQTETGALRELAKKQWTPEQVVECGELCYADTWRSKNALSLWTVAKEIGAKIDRNKGRPATPVLAPDGWVYEIKEENRWNPTH